MCSFRSGGSTRSLEVGELPAAHRAGGPAATGRAAGSAARQQPLHMEGSAPSRVRMSLAAGGAPAEHADATGPASSSGESRAVGRSAVADAATGRVQVVAPSAGPVALAAQAMPARLAWSPDPAWAAAGGTSSSGGGSTAPVTPARQSEPRKRARQGRVKKAARKAPAEEGGGAAGPASSTMGHPLAGDVWWQQRPELLESDEPFSDCSDMEDYYDSDDWADSEVEEDIEEQLEGSMELQTAALRRHQPRSIMDQSLSDLQDAPPVFPTPRRPDAVDLQRHRSLTDSIESLIHKSEQKDLINSAAKEVFDRFNRGEDGRISQLEFCTLVQNFGVGMDLSALRLWELCAPTLGPSARTRPRAGSAALPAAAAAATAPIAVGSGWGSSRLSLREFQSFYRKWLSTPELRAKLTRKLRRASAGESVNPAAAAAAAAGAAAERRCRLRTNRPVHEHDLLPTVSDHVSLSPPRNTAADVVSTDIEDTDDGLEASIDEMIELPEGHGVPFQLAIAMHPSSAAALAVQSSRIHGAGNSSSQFSQCCSQCGSGGEESLVVELLQGCERLETEKVELNQRMNELLVDHDTLERRVFEVELEKRGLTTLLEKETVAKQAAESALKTRDDQWRGIGTESLSDTELNDLLSQVLADLPLYHSFPA